MYEQPGQQAPSSHYAVPTPPRRKTGKTIAIVIAAVLLLCCCGGGLVLAVKPDAVSGFFKDIVEAVESNVANAKVGDCVNSFADVNDARVVDCTSAEAANRVAGVLPDKTETEFNADSACDPYPTTESAIWIGRKGGRGSVWCLEPVKK
ncbi:hypothetical protein ACFQZ4_20575 [Catellatospora coxensis]|uniref:Septum formation-related domain-containing protein n=1 Tax=Catellatospora coxensis TaxID=310354 RepID=A0A8J3PB38_9ACTN|nr:hypothetical protein [Catellatospora coxensis]GIG10249.1 hypothetical protein Cco03nite_69490 [Catellatospora coxensis]